MTHRVSEYFLLIRGFDLCLLIITDSEVNVRETNVLFRNEYIT